MTEGNAVKLILRFMVPLVLGNLFQQLYNVADSVIVGRYLGVNALAGVGQSASLTFLILGFVNGCCSGFAIPVAQCFGAKQYSQMRRFVFNAEILSVILAAVITTGTAFSVTTYCILWGRHRKYTTMHIATCSLFSWEFRSHSCTICSPE